MSLFTDWKFNWKDTQLNIPRGKGLCLDVGCGSGWARELVENAGYSYTGCDVDISRGQGIVQCDGTALPFKENSFNLIILWQVLEHVPCPEKFLREVKRVLMPGGKIIGSVSYLEPSHDKCMYYSFNPVGVKFILKKAGYVQIEIRNGINAFSLIMRNLLTRLLPRKLGEKAAFCIMQTIIVGLVYMILICRAVISYIKRGRLSDDYRRAYEYIAKRAPLDFAGHIQFIAKVDK